MILVNGVETDRISANDRGFQYGDGLFETIEIQNGVPVFLEQHLKRLNADCIRLNIPVPNTNLLNEEIYRVCRSAKRAVIKIIVTRGVGGRGYRIPDSVTPTRVISLHPYPDYPDTHAKTGINARFCATRLGLNPLLAGIKHLNRLENVMARSEWNDLSIQEGIMLDINNHVIEGTMSNLFYVKDKTTYTASLQFSGVAGVLRGIIKQLLVEHNYAIVECSFDKDSLLAADEVFVCNSIIGIWPLKQIEKVSFAVGSLTRQLQDWLSQLKEKVAS